MIVGDRVAERLAVMGITQAELARRVGVSQPTINNIIRRSKKGSTHLHKVARELGTSPAYLAGEVDDPQENAAPAATPPVIHHVMMAVALPEERALIRMFEALLRSMPDGVGLEEQAELLAKRLPIGLAQLRDLLPPEPAQSAAAKYQVREPVAALAIPDHERQR